MRRKVMGKRALAVGTLAAVMLSAATGCGGTDEADSLTDNETLEKEASGDAEMDFTVNMDGIATGSISAGVSVHDPSVVLDNGKYYIIGTHMTMAGTDDLRTFNYIGNGYNSSNPVFGDLFKDADSKVFYYTGKKDSVVATDDGGCHLWAPDIIYNKDNGLYYMYYCTSSTWNASTLGFATCETIDGMYEYGGDLIYSGITTDTLEKTDVLSYVDESYAKSNYIKSDGSYNFDEYPNALDPTVFYDKDDRLWMVYGSWSGGIYLLELDKTTGQVIHPKADPENGVDAYFGKKLLGGGHKSIEGPYILYDKDSDYYYLFVSYGGLASDGGYQIRVFRSKDVYGDYVDMNGQKPELSDKDHYGFGLKLSGNYDLPSLKTAYKATGHNSAFIDDDGKKYVVYHTRFASKGEYFEPRVKQYFLNEEGWPVMLPYPTDEETISENGYSAEEIAGRYYVDSLGLDISKNISEPFIIYLDEVGNVYFEGRNGDVATGSYTVSDGSYYMHISYDGTDYSGVFCKQKDEAGTEVMTFTACGANKTIWGVKYN